jgi:hypothetical protein|tara:strand:+ start:92 stop:538 length:447 start_codon:yes stop_codon:yes gene_type:complete
MKKITTKKQIILPILLLFMIGTIYAFSVPRSDEIVTQEVGVTFGNNSFCEGIGPCMLIPPDRFPGNNYDAIGEIIIGTDGKITLKIKKNSISVAKAEEQFKDDFFEVSKEVELLPSLSSESQRRVGESIIKKGKFPVVSDNDFYTISF